MKECPIQESSSLPLTKNPNFDIFPLLKARGLYTSRLVNEAYAKK
jgi:hypothetical protein